MESRRNTVFIGNMLVTLLLVGGVAGNANANPRSCGFPAIFNFGDSNSDTGASSTVFNELILPWGITAGKNNKRISDGRLLIDFFAEHLGLPYLNATVDSIGTSFRHGANFAVGGVKISPKPSGKGVSNFCLDVQVSQFLQFKSRSIALHKQLPINYNGARPPFKSMFPEPEVFSKALYTFDIGHNDFNSNFDGKGIAGIIDIFSNSVQRLLDDGAKFLWIHNTVPHGCLPEDLWKYKGGSLDEIGCLKSRNAQSQDFNKQLNETVYRLRTKYPEASITYVDTYSAKLLLIANAKKYGFESPFDFCCGNNSVKCGYRVDAEGAWAPHERGKLISPVCNDPSKYIFWDGVHFSEAAVKFYAPLIINGTYSDPPLPLAEACHKS